MLISSVKQPKPWFVDPDRQRLTACCLSELICSKRTTDIRMKKITAKDRKLSEAHLAVYMSWNAHFLHRYRKLGADALELRLGDIVLKADLAKEGGVDMSTAANALGLSRQTARNLITEWAEAGNYTFERVGRSTFIRFTPARRKDAVARGIGMIEMMYDCMEDISKVE
jgi:hypothetical protein